MIPSMTEVFSEAAESPETFKLIDGSFAIDDAEQEPMKKMDYPTFKMSNDKVTVQATIAYGHISDGHVSKIVKDGVMVTFKRSGYLAFDVYYFPGQSQKKEFEVWMDHAMEKGLIK